MGDAVCPTPHRDPPEVHLSQYLFVGKEFPNYQPGNWFVHNYYKAYRVPSIRQLVEQENKHLVPVELIKKAFESKMVQHPETLVFALAVCARQDKNDALRLAAYKLVNTVCAMPQHFILFIKFASHLSKSELGSKSGWGSGWKKTVNEWYLSKDALQLVKCVTRYKSRYGWKHKDIIKLSHPKTDDIAKQAVLKYVIHGLKEAKKEFNDKPEAVDVIKYIEDIENFKHCEDEYEAGRLLEMYNLTLDHVPGHLLKSEEVWNSLIPTMDLPMLLDNLQRIHNLGLFKPNAPTVGKVIDAIISKENILRDKLHPALVFITIRNYENSGKPLSYEKRKLKDEAKKPFPAPPKPNQKIIDALYKTLNLSFACLKPSGLRYMITIDMNKTMLDSRAWRCRNVTAAEAGCVIAVSHLRCEKNITIATFKDVGIHTVNLDKTASFGQAMRRLQQMPVGEINLSKPMTWAAHQNRKYDVFINVVDVVNQNLESLTKFNNAKEAIKMYRNKMNLPNAKLVIWAVSTITINRIPEEDKNTLTICGFDANVPKIIEAFAKSLF